MMWHSLIKERKSQIFISVLIIFAIIMGLGAALLFHSRSAREISRMQGDARRAYSLAKSGLDIGQRLGAGFPKTYNIGGGTLTLTLEGTTLTSTGTVGNNTRVLTRTIAAGTCTTWAKVYSGTGRDYVTTIRTISNGYIIHGKTDSWGAGSTDFLLLNINTDGGISWAKTYGSDATDDIDHQYGGNSLLVLPTGYIFGGDTDKRTWVVGNEDFLVIETNSSGNPVSGRSRTYGTSKVDKFYSIHPGISEGYILGGNTRLVSATKDNMLAIRTNVDGSTTGRWSRTYGNSTSITTLNGIESLPNNAGYVLVGYTNGWGQGLNDGIVIAINDNGIPLWAYTYGDSRDERIDSVKKSFNQSGQQDGFILGGTIYVSASVYHGFLMKIDTNGNLLWTREFGNDDPRSVRVLEVGVDADKGYLPVGRFYHSGEYDFLTLKFSPEGSLQWKRIYGDHTYSTGNDYQVSIDLANCGYILGGYSISYTGTDDIFVVSTDSAGSLSNCDMDLDNFTLNYNEANIPSFVRTQIATPAGNECVNLGCATNRGINGVVQTVTVRSHGTDFTIDPIITVCPQ